MDEPIRSLRASPAKKLSIQGCRSAREDVPANEILLGRTRKNADDGEWAAVAERSGELLFGHDTGAGSRRDDESEGQVIYFRAKRPTGLTICGTMGNMDGKGNFYG